MTTVENTKAPTPAKTDSENKVRSTLVATLPQRIVANVKLEFARRRSSLARISRTALSCLLRLKAYGAYPAGAAFGAGRTKKPFCPCSGRGERLVWETPALVHPRPASPPVINDAGSLRLLRRSRSRQTRIPKSAAAWMFDPCPLVAAPTAALAPVKLGRTLLLIIRPLGADDVTARRGRGSEEFGPLDAMPQHQQGTDPPSSLRMPQPRHDATLDQMLLAGAWSRAIARLGLTSLPALTDAGLRP